MPVTSSRVISRAEATNNVTSNFYDLNLHNASASGNLGLVGFALTRGQPVNSLLDGMLPLHFASSGGSDVVVRKLIEHGADVNAPSVNPPKLPRKHSNEKTPTVATAGSTPLHFAARNGHKNVVSTLLANGAHASRPDKAGMTPEMLARQKGWPECADLLQDWAAKAELVHTDADLRSRESRDDLRPNAFDSTDRLGALSSTDGEPIRKRTQIKNSIDRSIGGARNMMLKVSASGLHDAYKNHTSASTSTPPTRDSPSPFGKPLGEYTFYPTSTPSPSRSDFGDIDPAARRPSLPHLHMIPQRPRKASGSVLPPPSPQRPRSAGTGADQPPPAPVPSPTSSPRNPPKKLGSKYSLLGLFKKGQQDSPERSAQPLASASSTPPTAELFSDVGSPYAKPITRHRQGTDSSLRPSAVDLHNSLARDRSGSNASAISKLEADDSVYGDFDTSHRQRSGSPNGRMGILRSGRHIRDRSGSRSSNTGNGNRSGTVFDDDMIVVPGATPQRPGIGILKGHSRSISSGQPNVSPSSSGSGFQALRFDTAASNSSGSLKGNALGLRASNSVGSFGRSQEDVDEVQKTASLISPSPAAREPPESAPAGISDFAQSVKEVEDDDEYVYGRPIKDSSLHLKVRPTNTRPRGSSCASTDSCSLSPVMDNGEVDGLPSTSTFPFSIENPPPQANDGLLVPPARIHADNRGRGDSLSSTSTTDSANLLMSTSGTTSGSGSVTVMTPGLSPAATSVLGLSPRQRVKNIQLSDDGEEDEAGSGGTTIRLNDRRAQTPLDINIRSISSHAQAEALVQHHQQKVLDMSTNETPLSMRLAAYGESLALERRLREAKDRVEESPILESPPDHSPTRSKVAQFMRDAGIEPSDAPRRVVALDRQRSLDHRPSSTSKPRRVVKAPKRPNTSNGTPSHELTRSSLVQNEERPTNGMHHQVTRSVSATIHSSQTPQNTTAFVPDDSDDEFPHPIVRSHTPDDFESEAINAAVDDSPLGTPLYRTTTAPIETSSRRQLANTNKLTRMGFSADPAPRTVANKPRFLKSLMQTFKGKA